MIKVKNRLKGTKNYIEHHHYGAIPLRSAASPASAPYMDVSGRGGSVICPSPGFVVKLPYSLIKYLRFTPFCA